jgi:hypothetical protein
MRKMTTVLKNAQSILQGLILGVFLLEMVGALFVGWNWWEYRAGVQITRADLVAASGVVAAMALAPVLAALAFLLERRDLPNIALAIWLGIAALIVRLALLAALGVSAQTPWALEILNGKRPDFIVGSLATCIWFGLIHFSRRRA